MRPLLNRGFTLIELMITVAIVGIIAAIAYPSYIDSVRAGRRSEAMSALLKLQLAQEKWRANNTSYTSTIGGTCTTGLCWSSADISGTYYTIAISAASSSGFTGTATPVSGKGQENDKANGVNCSTSSSPLKVNQDGPITSDGGIDKSACWKKN